MNGTGVPLTPDRFPALQAVLNSHLFGIPVETLWAVLFAVIISIPAVGWSKLRWNPVFSFWFAYVVTRPLGASFADGFSKNYDGGLNTGDPLVSLVAFIAFAGMVAYAAVTKLDVQAQGSPHPHATPEPDATSGALGHLAYERE